MSLSNSSFYEFIFFFGKFHILLWLNRSACESLQTFQCVTVAEKTITNKQQPKNKKEKKGNHVVAPRSSSSRLFLHPSLRQRQRVSFFFFHLLNEFNCFFVFFSSNGLLWFVAFRLACFFYFTFCCWGREGSGPNCHGIWVSQKAENPTSRVVASCRLCCCMYVQSVNGAPTAVVTREMYLPAPQLLLQFQKSK